MVQKHKPAGASGCQAWTSDVANQRLATRNPLFDQRCHGTMVLRVVCIGGGSRTEIVVLLLAFRMFTWRVIAGAMASDISLSLKGPRRSTGGFEPRMCFR